MRQRTLRVVLYKEQWFKVCRKMRAKKRMGKAAATSKASRKNQTTIPARVRRALSIAKGDTLLWTIDGDEVSIRILNKVNIDWKKTSELSLLEWTPQEDEEASL